MSFTLTPSSFTINGSGHLIAAYPNGTSNDIGNVVGQAGASGDLFLPVQKTASYTLLAGDLNGQQTPAFSVLPATASVFTVDAALLFNNTTTQTLAVDVIHDAADVSGNTVTVAAKSGQTLNGVASWVLPVGWCYTIIAKSPTALAIV